jgi:2-iminobutanoate/2-iminopropanoate deaminase
MSKEAVGVLAAAGASPADVVRCGVYLNDAYAHDVSHPLPARTTIGATLRGFKVEIDCVAVLERSG